MEFTHTLYIGAVTWTHPAWQGSVYPEDLPGDWMLSYYNTQFQAVFLPASVWQPVDAETWSQWLHDTQPEFVFVLELADATIPLPVTERILTASPEWMARYVWWLDDKPDLRALAQRIAEQTQNGEPLFVFSRQGNVELLQQVSTLKHVLGI